MNKVNFKDISEFELKETLDGTEEIQVSSTEKINLKDQFDKANNIYVADFTIEDLENSLATNSILKINARALIQALSDKKAIGVLQKETTSNDYVSMLIASAYKDGRSIFLTVTSNLKMYDVIIDSGAAISPEVADSESGQIHWGFIQVIPIETSFAPFLMSSVINATEGIQWRVHKDSLMAILETNKPLFIQEDNPSGVVPTSYLITKQDDGNPTAIDMDIIYNKGLYHIHWDITDDPNLFLNSDTVSYTPFSAYITEFTIEDLKAKSTEENPQLTISRAFLDAAYKGVPIMVKIGPTNDATVPVIVDVIDNPNKGTLITFRVQCNNDVYRVACSSDTITTGTIGVSATITHYNSIDWNVEDPREVGYIANRTHYFKWSVIGNVGQRVPLSNKIGTHYIGNYKVLYDGKLYDLPTAKGGEVSISNYFKIIFSDYLESGTASTYVITSQPISQLEKLPSYQFRIVGDFEGSGSMALDEFYLPDGAKPWKTITANQILIDDLTLSYFSNTEYGNIDDGVTVIRNKTIYIVSADIIRIAPYSSKSVIEFKIKTNKTHNLQIADNPVWENGENPSISDGDEVIYSFLMLGGKIYASAKVYKTAQ